MSSSKSRSFSHIGEFIAVFLYSLWAYSLVDISKFVRVTSFQVRDLARAHELLHGNWIFFGPEMTGGGHLPGPIFYILLAAALKIKDIWTSPLELMVGLNALAAAAGWLYFRTRVSLASAFVFVGLFLISPSMENYLGMFMNVSFMGFFVTAAILLICEAYPGGEVQPRSRALVAAGFLLGLAIQLHFSSAVLWIAILGLQVAGPRLGVRRQSIGTLILAVCFFLYPLIPFFIWDAARDFGLNFGQAPLYAGATIAAPSSLFWYLNFPSLGRIVSGSKFLVATVPLALPIVLLALYVGRENAREKVLEFRKYEIALGFCALAGIIPALYVFFAPIAHRYSMVYSIASVCLVVVLFDRLRSRAGNFAFIFLALIAVAGLVSRSTLLQSGYLTDVVNSRHLITAIAMCAGLVAALRRKMKVGVPICLCALALAQNPSIWRNVVAARSMTQPSAWGWWQVGKKLCEETNWPVDQIANRIYFVDGNMGMDPRPIFSALASECEHTKGPQNGPSGFFLAFVYDVNGKPFSDWLVKHPIADEIKQGIASGGLRLGAPETIGSLVAVPFNVLDMQNLPGLIHNIGIGYVVSSQQQWLQSHGTVGEVTKLKDGKYLMKWNDCPDRRGYCDTGALLTVHRHEGATKIEVWVMGDSLSQNSPWVRPEWTESWDEPYIDVRCNKERHRLSLAKSIGYSRQYGVYRRGYKFYLANHSLLTPYWRELNFPCPINEITIGRQSTTVDKIETTTRLSAQSLSVSI